MIKALIMAVSMFTVIPCPNVWDENRRQEMLLCLPAAGLVIGLCWAGAAKLFSFLELSFLSAAVLTVLPWFLSGFIHLDGFMDCADAVMSRAPLEKKLQILKDSRVGAFAVIMCVVLTLLSFGAFLEMDLHGKEWILIWIPVLSRALTSAAVLNIPPLETSSYAYTLKGGVKKGYRIWSILFVLILLIAGYLCSGKTAVALLVETAGFLLTLFHLRKELGGMSGDISGCCVTTAELWALIALAVLC